MRVGDIDEVWRVEQSAFTTPWSKKAFYNELTFNQFAHYTVVVVDGRIQGYCGMWVIVDEAHITNVALAPEVQRRKIGTSLMVHMMVLANALGAERMTLEVRVSNNPAQSLYRKMGFVESGVRPRYYSDNMEDALIMWVDLDAEALERVAALI